MRTGPRLFEVRLVAVPLVLRERSRQQGADLLREMALIRTGQAGGAPSVHAPSRLLALAHELDTSYAPYVAATNDELDAALDRGEDTVDEVVYQLPANAVAFVQHVRHMLEEVERFCRSDGYLLTLAPSAGIAAYRDWSMDEVQMQHDGATPTPWPAFAAARGLCGADPGGGR